MMFYLLLSLLCLVFQKLVSAQSYDDFSWVKSFAAVGDSFTAGIGSGNVYSDAQADVDCSRYDYSYPVLMYRFLPNVQNFQYLACSGDTSADIISQIDAMNSGQDLVVLTAGGNDLCLSSIITTCIVNRFSSESACQDILAQADASANSFLGENIIALIQAIDAKMNKNGVIVLSTYAPYFNTETTPCGTTENWGWPFGGLKLTTDHRSQFNTLVSLTNFFLTDAANFATVSNAKVVVADWSSWPQVLGGQFCEPGASPNPSDPSNAGVMFFKWDTSPVNLGDVPVGPLRIRGNVTSNEFDRMEELDYVHALEMGAMQEEAIMAKRREKEEARDLHALAERGITAPSCPANSLLANIVQYFLTDETGKIFHPNKLGHEVMAGFAIDQVRIARAEILGIAPPGCAANALTCFQGAGSTAYASAYSLYSNTADFCSSVASNAPSNVANWGYSKSYNVGTLDESTWNLQLSNGASSFDQNQCNTAMNQILDGCDGSSSNPMNWKFGGQNTLGSYAYSISPKRTNRPFPPPTAPKQSCTSWYKLVLDAYDIYGAGWASWDWGQQTLRPNSTSCFGLGITNWHFEYFDAPDSNGYEWHAWFNSPIWTRSRCYNNNKVQNAAGGGDQGGCSGNG